VAFVIREVEPVLHELGTDQEEAASTLGAQWWQTFWRITLPSIRWGLTYGIVLTVARTLVGCYGANVPVTVTGAFRLGDIRHNYADLGKARRLLDFEPRVDFQAGLRRFSDWVKQQVVEEDTYERSIREMRDKGLFKS